MGSNLHQNIDSLLGKLENFISTKTVVGEAQAFGDVIILPLVEVNFAVGAGAGESTDDDKKQKERGGGGLGARVTPTAVLVINKDGVQMININEKDGLSKLMGLAPGILNKITSAFGKKGEKTEEE